MDVDARSERTEILLTGAQVADGTGAALQSADVLVLDGRIATVGATGSLSPHGRQVRDLSGLVLAPGFIDVHSHADNAPLLDYDDTTKILQGVTTEIVGNCGFSLAPRLETHAETLSTLAQRVFPPLDWQWWTSAEFFAVTDARGYVTNYCPLVGHGTLRAAAQGLSGGSVDADGMAVMRRELESSMDAGAFGLSSGLIYPPGVFSDTAELVALAKVLGGSGLYATHMRGEADTLFPAIDEALRVGAVAGRTHISHLKSSGKQNWGKMPEALKRIRAARDGGAGVFQDVYPYTASSTLLTAMLPTSFLDCSAEETMARLEGPAGRDELASGIENGLPGWENHVAGAGWDGILVATTTSHADEGKTLAEIASTRGIQPVDALIEILLRERLQALVVVFSMREDDLEAALADEHTMIGSDGLPPGTGGKPHPRLFGTFPRVLGRYSRDREVLSLPEAVRRMTSLPAAGFGIPERGLVARGYVADLVAFDAATIADVGDYRDPVHPPAGIPFVMHAGAVVVEGGNYCGPRSGVRLTPA